MEQPPSLFDAALSLVGGELSMMEENIITYHSGQTEPTKEALLAIESRIIVSCK